MTDSDRSDKQMAVTLHKEDEPDFSVEESAFETVGISVDNAVPIGVLEDLADAWERQNEQVMEDIDPTASHYTGCTGAACMGRDLCVNDLREVINDYGDTDE